MKRLFTLSDKYHGSSSPVLFSWQKPQGSFIATSGSNESVNIFDRHGELKEQIPLQGFQTLKFTNVEKLFPLRAAHCIGLGWDKDGDILAMINDKTSQILLWDANNYRLSQLDISFKETSSVLVWSKVSSLLAVGTSKGNLLIYNHRTSKKIPVVGKHTKRIVCGCWSEQDLLAMAGDDKVLSISNQEGDTVRQLNLRAEPYDIQFSEMKQDERSVGENTISLILGKKTLFLYNLNDPENPVELAFQAKYGNIVAYEWFGDGYVLIGFSFGYFVAISTHMKEIGQELFQARNHKGSLVGVAVNTTIGKAASCGENIIKVHELSDLKETYTVITVDDEPAVNNLDWTEDGQLMAVSTPRGNLHVYLSKLPILGYSYNTRLIYLTSLLEVTIVDSIEKEKPVMISAEVEPSFLCLGPYNFSLGMNNRAWFYAFGETGPELVCDKEYLGTVQNMHMNADYACVLYEGKLHLHLIDGESIENEGRESLMFPDGERGDVKITCHSLTGEFLIYGTESGGIFYFLLEDWQMVNEYKHETRIKNIYLEPTGVQLIFLDDNSDGFIYNPVNDNVLAVPDIPNKVLGVLWDKSPFDKDIFVVYDDEKIYTYLYKREDINGTKVISIGSTNLPRGQFPVMLYGGELTCQTQGGKTTNFTLGTHDLGGKNQNLTKDEAMTALEKCLALRRFKEAWSVCQIYDEKDYWTMLGRSALENVDIDTAIEVYRQIKDVGTVWTLQSFVGIEDRNLLAGNIATVLGNYDSAQEHYLNSSNPSMALDMRRDLMQWDQALQLAKKLAPEQIPHISKEHAQQLEFMGEYSNALSHYEKGILNGDHLEHNNTCNAGIARMAIRCGDIRRGVGLAERLDSQTVKKECAEILETMKQFAEASILYEKGGYYDKAASLYIRLKNWQKIGELLPSITSPKILLQFAKAKEADGRYKDAAEAYKKARDFDNLIRIQLDHLKNPEEAVRIVKETQSIEGAKMVARFFQNLNDYPSAIQFLVMSKCNDEAFRLAQQYGKMSLYTDAIGGDASNEEYRSVACYFENEKNHFQAGKFYYLAKDYTKALKHLLKVSGKEESVAVQLATDVVGDAQDPTLTQQLITYLLGEIDGIPKDAKYLFKLYMACKQYREAAKTAVIIAREEQNSGNYRNAHDVLFTMYRELRKQKIKILSEMNTALMILHSYILVKIHVKRGDHLKGARMLIRVANNISRFPSHVVPILTSTVIECHRSGLKNSSFSYAAMLMRPEYRNQIDLKYKKKIEAIIRKPQRTEEEEDCTPCPYCNNLIAETELFCSECKNNLPYCIITGQHILLNDLTECPMCHFPAILTEFIKHIEADGVCPMCSEEVNVNLVNRITDSKPFLYPDGSE